MPCTVLSDTDADDAVAALEKANAGILAFELEEGDGEDTFLGEGSVYARTKAEIDLAIETISNKGLTRQTAAQGVLALFGAVLLTTYADQYDLIEAARRMSAAGAQPRHRHLAAGCVAAGARDVVNADHGTLLSAALRSPQTRPSAPDEDIEGKIRSQSLLEAFELATLDSGASLLVFGDISGVKHAVVDYKGARIHFACFKTHKIKWACRIDGKPPIINVGKTPGGALQAAIRVLDAHAAENDAAAA
jgi:hypothetical protein